MLATNLRVFCDPGHGFGNITPGKFDAGASVGTAREADINLAYALALKFYLNQLGVHVEMSRNDNTDPAPVGSRDNRAAALGCNLSISIHCNAGPKAASGIETFFRDAEDKKLATVVHNATVIATHLPDRGVRNESQSQHPHLAVLEFKPPACLVELGYLTNNTDLNTLLQKATRVAWGSGVAAAIVKNYGSK